MTDEEPWRMPAPSLVLECIERWRSLDLRSATDAEVARQISSLIDDLGEYTTSAITYSGLRKLYRVRPLDKSFPWSSPQDFLYAPPHRAKRGRCNLPNDPVLYCSPKKVTALQEMLTGISEATPANRFAMIDYAVIGEFSLAQLVGPFDPNPKRGPAILSGQALLSAQILREFVRSEFTKPVGAGTEYLYKISAAICRVWFDPKEYHGWKYPSVAAPDEECVALKRGFADSKQVTISRVEVLDLLPQTVPGVWDMEVCFELDDGGCWVPPQKPTKRRLATPAMANTTTIEALRKKRVS